MYDCPVFFRSDLVHAPVYQLHDEQAKYEPKRNIDKQIIAFVCYVEYIEDTPPVEVVERAVIPKVKNDSERVGQEVEESEWDNERFDFLFQESGEWFFFEKESGEKEEKCIYVGYIVPLRVYSVTPYDTDDGDSFNKVDVIDSF